MPGRSRTQDEVRWKGPEELTSLLVPIDSITPWPGNPRHGDVGAIVTSLRRFGAEMLKEIAQQGDLEGTGFDGDDVDDLLAKIEAEPGIKPQLAISAELMEEHNYVVLYFDNALDWNVAVEVLGIETKKTPDSTDTYHRAGIGRVIRGIDVIQRIRKAGG